MQTINCWFTARLREMHRHAFSSCPDSSSKGTIFLLIYFHINSRDKEKNHLPTDRRCFNYNKNILRNKRRIFSRWTEKDGKDGASRSMHLFLARCTGDNRNAIEWKGISFSRLLCLLPSPVVGEVAREIAGAGARGEGGDIYGENSRTWFSWLVPGTVEIHHISSVMPRNAAGRCTLHINDAREAYRATLLHVHVFRTHDFRLSGCNTHRKSAV